MPPVKRRLWLCKLVYCLTGILQIRYIPHASDPINPRKTDSPASDECRQRAHPADLADPRVIVQLSTGRGPRPDCADLTQTEKHRDGIISPLRGVDRMDRRGRLPLLPLEPHA